jgi:hypothetical protein
MKINIKRDLCIPSLQNEGIPKLYKKHETEIALKM